MSLTAFKVPESLSPHVDGDIYEAHQRLADTTLRDFWETMPDSTLPKHTDAAEMVDLAPYDDHDRASAIVLPLPFANGWAPHMALRARLLQDSIPEPTRLIVFPNDKRSYNLSAEEQETVASGNFAPIAEKQLQSLRSAKIEKISVIGYSQGATVGACALKLAAQTDSFEIGNSGLFEAPNVIGRTPNELRKQFMASGKGLDKAVNDSGIPALSEAQHSRGGLDVIGKFTGLVPFVIRTQSGTNRAIHKGFTYPRFMQDVTAAMASNTSFEALIANAAESPIMPAESIDDIDYLSAENARIRTRTIEGYGHEMGDNIVVHAVLAKLALKRAG
jgi:predicted esterase